MNLIYKEFKQILSNKLFVGMWLIILVALCIVMSVDVKEDKNTVSEGAVIGLVNDDNSQYSNIFISFLSESDEFSKVVTLKQGEYDEMHDLFYAGELDALIYIEDGFIDNLMDVKETPLTVLVSDEDTVTAVLVSNIMEAYQQYVTAIQMNITALYDQYRDLGYSSYKSKLNCFTVTYVLVGDVFEKTNYLDMVEVKEHRSSGIITYLIYAAITIIIMYSSLFAGIDILKEKSYWVLNRYLISKSSTAKFILVKNCFYTLVIFALMFIPTYVSSIIKHKTFNWKLMLLFLIFTFTSVCFSSLLSFVLGNINVFALVANMLYIVWIIVGGGIIPVTYMPDKLYKLTILTPTRMFIKCFVDVHDNKTLDGSVKSLYVCIIVSIISIILSCIFFKKNTYRQE